MRRILVLFVLGACSADRWWCGDRACYRDQDECATAHRTTCSGARIAFCPVGISGQGLQCAASLEGCEANISRERGLRDRRPWTGDREAETLLGALAIREAMSAKCLGGE